MYALQCRLNRKVNIAQILKNLKYRNNREFFKHTMSKIMQNLVVLMEPSEKAWNTSLKGVNMILNRIFIDEDAAFELSGVNYLKKPSLKMFGGESCVKKVKGKDYLLFRSETVFLYIRGGP